MSRPPSATQAQAQQMLVHSQLFPVAGPFQPVPVYVYPTQQHHPPVNPQPQPQPQPQSQTPTQPAISIPQLSDAVALKLAPGLSAGFNTLHQNTLDAIDKISVSINALSARLDDSQNGNSQNARDHGQSGYDQVTAVVEASYTVQMQAVKKVLERVDRLEKYVKAGAGRGDVNMNEGVVQEDRYIQRLTSIEGAVRELLEWARASQRQGQEPPHVQLSVSPPLMQEVGTTGATTNLNLQPQLQHIKSHADTAASSRTDSRSPFIPESTSISPRLRRAVQKRKDVYPQFDPEPPSNTTSHQQNQTENHDEDEDEDTLNEEEEAALLSRVRASADLLAKAIGNGFEFDPDNNDDDDEDGVLPPLADHSRTSSPCRDHSSTCSGGGDGNINNNMHDNDDEPPSLDAHTIAGFNEEDQQQELQQSHSPRTNPDPRPNVTATTNTPVPAANTSTTARIEQVGTCDTPAIGDSDKNNDEDDGEEEIRPFVAGISLAPHFQVSSKYAPNRFRELQKKNERRNSFSVRDESDDDDSDGEKDHDMENRSLSSSRGVIPRISAKISGPGVLAGTRSADNDSDGEEEDRSSPQSPPSKGPAPPFQVSNDGAPIELWSRNILEITGTKDAQRLEKEGENEVVEQRPSPHSTNHPVGSSPLDLPLPPPPTIPFIESKFLAKVKSIEEYVRFKQAPRLGKKRTVFSFIIYYHEGDPPEKLGHPSDVYLDTTKGRERVLAKTSETTWEEWRFFLPSPWSLHKIKNPLIPETLLWARRDTGITWSTTTIINGDRTPARQNLLGSIAEVVRMTIKYASTGIPAMADVLPNDNDDEENRPAVLNIGHAPQPDLSKKRTPRPDHEHLDGSSFDVTSATNQHDTEHSRLSDDNENQENGIGEENVENEEKRPVPRRSLSTTASSNSNISGGNATSESSSAVYEDQLYVSGDRDQDGVLGPLRLCVQSPLRVNRSEEPGGGDEPLGLVDLSTTGVHGHPDLVRLTSSSSINTSSDNCNPFELQYPPTPHSSTPRPRSPARDIPEGSIAALRCTVLGDHLFVKPSEDGRSIMDVDASRVVQDEDENHSSRDAGSEGGIGDYSAEGKTPILSPLMPPPPSLSPRPAQVPAAASASVSPALPSLTDPEGSIPAPCSEASRDPLCVKPLDVTGVGEGEGECGGNKRVSEAIEEEGGDFVSDESMQTPVIPPSPAAPHSIAPELTQALPAPGSAPALVSASASPVFWSLPGSPDNVHVDVGIGMQYDDMSFPESDVRNQESVSTPLTPDTTPALSLLGPDRPIKMEWSHRSDGIERDPEVGSEETITPLSALELELGLRDQQVSGANASVGNTNANPSTMEPQRKGKKRKSNGFTSRKQHMKKIKMETETETKVNTGHTEPSIPLSHRPNRKPPRGRPKKSSLIGSASASASRRSNQASSSKGKFPSCDRQLLCDWPAKVDGDGKFFVQCDNCDQWYHGVCVGIWQDNLDDDKDYFCPPCLHTAAKRTTLRHRLDVCSRPDCSFPGHTVEKGEYAVDRIVGRKLVGGARFSWLVKWLGYPIVQATWTPEENMGDHAKLVKRFNDDATAEGLDISVDDLILLEEAVQGGWE